MTLRAGLRAFLASCLGALLLISCTGNLAGPGSVSSLGKIGPFPADLTGNVAFVVLNSVTSGSVSYFTSTVFVVEISTSQARVVFTGKDLFVEGLTWAPDGQHLVMQTLTPQPLGPNGENRSIRQLQSLSAHGAIGPVLYNAEGPEYHPTYSADGRLAYFGGWSTDPAHGVFIDGEPVLDIGLITSNSDLAWLPDGSGLIFTEQTSGIWRLDLADKEVNQLVAREGDEVSVSPAVSPDGSRIAVSRYAGASGNGEIWTFGITGADALRLTTGFADDDPQWTPGGKYLAFSRWLGGGSGVYLIDPNGGTPVRVIAGTGLGVNHVVWTR